MKKKSFTLFGKWMTAAGVLGAIVLALAACKKEAPHPQIPGSYKQVNLVANTAAYNAVRIDTFLRDGWGIAFSAGGTPWVSSARGAVSTVYTPEGAQARGPVYIPSPNGPFDGAFGGVPTGQVFNGSSDFVLPNNLPGRFIFVGADGILSAWNSGNTAWKLKDNSSRAAYTGLAIASSNGANFLYAADFRGGRIEVWNRTFDVVTNMPFKVPTLPQGCAPFNIQAVGDKLYVAYAQVGPDGFDVKGPGKGYVSIFNTDGSFVKRFASRGILNSPWGIAMASPTFIDAVGGGSVAGAILIGNFGDGTINAFSPDGDFLGQLKENGKVIKIDGLWAISYPPATATTVDRNRLYFAAGPKAGEDGLFGYIIKATVAAP